jgi:hypothetical protein
MISENMFLIPRFARLRFCKEDTYIVLAEDLSIDNKPEETDDSREKLTVMNERLERIEKMLRKKESLDDRLA